MQDVTLAALYVSSKMHDTLKKPREIVMVSYAVRFPELAAKSKSIVGEIDMDPQVCGDYQCFTCTNTESWSSLRLLRSTVRGFWQWRG